MANIKNSNFAFQDIIKKRLIPSKISRSNGSVLCKGKIVHKLLVERDKKRKVIKLFCEIPRRRHEKMFLRHKIFGKNTINFFILKTMN